VSCIEPDSLVLWRAVIESVPSPWGWVVIGAVALLALIGLCHVLSFFYGIKLIGRGSA